MWSLLAVLVSGFRWCFALCLFIVLLVQFGLLGDRLLGGGCPLGWRFVLVVFCLFVVFVCFPLWFLGGVCLLVVPVPVHCFSIAFRRYAAFYIRQIVYSRLKLSPGLSFISIMHI